jgi:hypothetical protein
MKKDCRGRWDVENTLQDTQPDVPANATRVMNPNGFVSQVPSGTMCNGAGGDGRDYNWPGAMSEGPKWNSNPMPEGMDPYSATPGNVTFATKASKSKK